MAAPRSPQTSVHDSVVRDTLEKHKAALNDISQAIWKKPEENYEEHFAHQVLTDFLEKNGFQVTRQYKKLATAFRAEFQSADFKQGEHATIAVICEYDALPEIGHACGHNLIAESGVAAGLALQQILKNDAPATSADRVEGKVVVLGTPAEEGGGGKILLIKEGAFKDIDFAVMVHPSGYNDLEPICLGIERCHVKFHGKAAHASCGPWEGVNALDAAVSAYQSVSMYRQQMKPNWRIHGIITNGGAKPNIIPDLTESNYYIRAQTAVDVSFLKEKIVTFFAAAAKATGCTMEVEWENTGYSGMIHCSTMSQLYKKFSAEDGVIFGDHCPSFSGSTDMGDVSVQIPSIHPMISLGKPLMIHTRDFQSLAGSPEAQKYILSAARSMALTCVELFTKKELRDKAKEEFQQKKKNFTG